MSDIKWIKLATGLFDNRKIKAIEAMPDGDTLIVIWLKLLILAGETNDNGYVYFTKDIPFTDELLVSQFSRPLNTIRLALNTFKRYGMIDIVDDVILVSNWERYQNTEGLEKIREQGRKRQAKWRAKQQLLTDNVTDNVTVTQGNATEKEEDIEIEKDIEKEEGEEARSAPPVSEIQQIKDAWNAISFTDNIKEILPGTSRWNELQLTIHMYGFDTVMEAIGKVEESEYLHKKGHVRFDQYIHRDGVQKLIEGFYQEEYKKNKDGTVDSWLEEIRNA